MWAGLHLVMWGSLGRKKIVGRENLPKTGPYIIVTNHVGIADVALVYICLPKRLPLTFLIGEKWRDIWSTRFLADTMGGIYVDRNGVDRAALRKAMDALKRGEILGLAPEGTRSSVGRLIKPRNGAAWIATQANVPIVPIALVNTRHLFQNGKRLRPTTMTAIIGEPFTLPELNVRRYRQPELSAFSDYIMLRIAKFLPPHYHGYYAYTNHPGLQTVLDGRDPWLDCLDVWGIET